MNIVADALVYATAYIACRDDENDETYLEEDTKALEFLSFLLRGCSEPDLDTLAAAAKRAHAELLASSPSPDPRWVDAYGRWMEQTFVDGWSGNDRV